MGKNFENKKWGVPMRKVMRKSTIMKVEGQTGLTAIGWDLANINEDQWNEAGEILVKIDQARQWWLGDWWNACKWGDGKAACERIGVNYQTAVNCGNVSEKIQSNRRRLNLSFSHHAEVCPIEDESMQDNLLDWAETEKATVKALRKRVNTHVLCTRKAREGLARIEASKIYVSQQLSDVRDLIGDEKYEEWFVAEVATKPWFSLAREIGAI